LSEQRASVALCIPTLGPPTWALFDSFGQWQSYHYQQHPDIAVTVIRPPRSLPIALARTYLAREVLRGGYDYLWFTDQDASYLPQTLDRLMAWNVPIVGALCLIRAPAWCTPMVFRGQKTPGSDFYKIPVDEVYNYLRMYADVEQNGPQIIEPVPEGSLFECDFTGCHCLLIKREVLETMTSPWFAGDPGQEDRYFCLEAKKAGFPVYVDFSTFVGHATGVRLLGVYDFMAHYLYQSLLEGIDVGSANRENGTEEV